MHPKPYTILFTYTNFFLYDKRITLKRFLPKWEWLNNFIQCRVKTFVYDLFRMFRASIEEGQICKICCLLCICWWVWQKCTRINKGILSVSFFFTGIQLSWFLRPFCYTIKIDIINIVIIYIRCLLKLDLWISINLIIYLLDILQANGFLISRIKKRLKWTSQMIVPYKRKY